LKKRRYRYNMQAVLLAAGDSSRFFPLNLRHKCLVKIAGDPIIVHTIRSVKKSGITDIILITGKSHEEFEKHLSSGKKFGVKIRYIRQEKPTGAGDAILLASKYITSDFFLINSNHVEFDELKSVIDSKRGTNNNVVLLARKRPIPSKHGVLKVDGDKVLRVIEKPKDLKGMSDLGIIGVYFINQDFIKVLKSIKSSHYSLEDALDNYSKLGRVRVAITDSPVLSLKYPWELLETKNRILSKMKRSISKKANVSKLAIIEGNVVIEDGAKVSENAVLKGPCYIGRNVFIGTNTLIRNGSDIEEDSSIGAYMEVKNTLFQELSKTHSGFIGDSVVGRNVRIGALFGSANVRLDRKSIRTNVKSDKIDTGISTLGAVIGDNTVIGERVSTMPGVIIGNNVNIGPSTTVMNNIDSNVIYYTKFAEIIEKNKAESTQKKF
jgi:bifunctional UDP-N-acetylglucosamine pyrophosphorylase/glucosamine-1-phosphate N-acetyltransferase